MAKQPLYPHVTRGYRKKEIHWFVLQGDYRGGIYFVYDYEDVAKEKAKNYMRGVLALDYRGTIDSLLDLITQLPIDNRDRHDYNSPQNRLDLAKIKRGKIWAWDGRSYLGLFTVSPLLEVS